VEGVKGEGMKLSRRRREREEKGGGIKLG
jgi:hypothetical protein